ncbi:hypothetical protein P152DRAFT_86949 [Eremomyces bilateralis CBS 781.70]|uniref:Mg2+ transporter protein n=1 Tax=Eremomyces bilateralis CBS 781.70 TaxID=1392243 RepID=A0A6G1FYL9_9PEZI|nr:uncharacterized protein P152DRAFT_86949 [Eremomyces bilateralis CBS 781.70]KAF1810883.1 hypothetical protein P152DRAFT_86949 [Eremomyces bilateralis CBS 781.70]
MAIAKKFQIPDPFLSFVWSNTMITTTFTTPSGGHGYLTNISSHAIVITHDPSTLTTFCFTVGMCQHQISSILQELEKSKHLAGCPELLPILWLETFLATRVRRCHGRSLDILAIQKDTGLHWSIPATEAQFDKLDLHPLTHGLTVLRGELAWDEHALDFLKGLGEKLAIGQREHSFAPRELHTARAIQDNEDLQKRIVTALDMIQGLHRRGSYSIQQVKVLLTTVHNLISQRDSRIAAQTAEATRQVVCAQQRDSAAMRAIAEDSNQVAALTRRDSADMRVIAGVTLLFLPATFTATFFSTGFFNFQGSSVGGGGATVSRWLWLYCVITIMLTIFVMVTWLVVSRRQRASERKHRTAFQLAEEKRESCYDAPEGRGNVPDADLEVMGEVTVTRLRSVRQEELTLEESAGPRLRIPSSKVAVKGVTGDGDTCACCASPLSDE